MSHWALGSHLVKQFTVMFNLMSFHTVFYFLNCSITLYITVNKKTVIFRSKTVYTGPLPQLYGSFLHIFQLRSFQIIILQTFLIAIIINNNIGKYLLTRQKRKKLRIFGQVALLQNWSYLQKWLVSIKFHLVKWGLLIKVSYAKLSLILKRLISFWEFLKIIDFLAFFIIFIK